MIHIVKEGETLFSIANMHGVSVERLQYDNQIGSDQPLVIGQALLVLIPRIVHQVMTGDSLYSIAQEYQTTIPNLLRNNPYLDVTGYLIEGESIVVEYESPHLGNLRAKGYAYPYVDEVVLREALLYIQELLIFSYGFTENGDLIPPQDEPLIRLAEEYEVSPILVLTPFTETGTFNNQLVKTVSENLEVQQRLIQHLLQTVEEKNYDGIDVDFEYILPEDREGYAAFVGNLTAVMNARGYQVSVALAPKVSDEQPGLLYEGVDYGLLGESANSVLLMTYEWGYTYGPPMGVAPINKVRQVLDYAVTKIPPAKTFMGIPNYAYDWPLPFERGITRADSIGNPEAVALAASYGVEIQFDEIAQTPFFFYESQGITHEVWFEDVRSMEAKYRTALDYGFVGVGYWNLMRPFRANWLLLHTLFQLE